jgi:DNA-binding NarL/FixJ family response regulator
VITVFLCDDHLCFVESLSLALPSIAFKVVGCASNGLDAIHGIESSNPQVAVIDALMPGMNGIFVAEEILKQCPKTKIIMLYESLTEEQLAAGLECHVLGFLEKADSLESLKDAICRVISGKVYLSKHLQPLLSRTCGRERGNLDRISTRERQVLQLIAEGQSTKQIAGLLRISEKTVDCYRTRLMTKLDIRGVASLVRYAVRRGWVQP